MDDNKIQFLTDALLSHYDNYDRDRYALMHSNKPITIANEKGKEKRKTKPVIKYKRDKKTGEYLLDKNGNKIIIPETNYNVHIPSAINKHVRGGTPIGLYLRDDLGRIIAFDIDKDLKKVPEELKELERQRLKQATIEFINVVHGLDLDTFVYLSGGKGYHVEIRTKEFMDVSKLVHVCEVIKQMADELGIGEY